MIFLNGFLQTHLRNAPKCNAGYALSKRKSQKHYHRHVCCGMRSRHLTLVLTVSPCIQNMHKRWRSKGKPEFYAFSTTDDQRDVGEDSSWQGAVELSMDTWRNSAEERARLMATNPSAEELLVANQELHPYTFNAHKH